VVLHAQPEAEQGSPGPRAGAPGLSALEIAGLLDGPGLSGLDRLTRLAAQALGVPIALATLATGREQFLASTSGLAEPGASRWPTSRSHPFCRYVVESGLPLVLEDGRLDELSADPAIPDLGMVAFAGFPLLDPNNHVLGSFCAIDIEPRNWSSGDLAVLENLAASAASEITLLRANQQLTRSAAWLHDALASAHDGYLSIDARGAIQDWNPAAERLFGWSKAEVSGRNLGEAIIPERFRSAHDRALAGIFAGETSAPVGGHLEFMAVDRAGVEFRVRTTLQLATSTKGTVIRALFKGVGAGRDNQADLEQERTFLAAVLDRAQAALDEEKRRLRQAQAIGRIGSWEWDVASNAVTWSETLFELYGVDPARFTADQANHLCIHPDDLEAMGTAFRLCAETGRAVVLRYRVVRPADGEVRLFEARAERLTAGDGRAARVAGTAMDVTDQVRAQGEATSRDAMLRAIIANSESLICVKDLAGRYVLANEAFERAFSVVEAELLGKDDVYVDPVQAPTWRANDLRAQEGDYAVEEWSDRADGRHLYDSIKFPL
jgi:PAS domain S-box-containing protein